jgi:hypothetical protein
LIPLNGKFVSITARTVANATFLPVTSGSSDASTGRVSACLKTLRTSSERERVRFDKRVFLDRQRSQHRPSKRLSKSAARSSADLPTDY